MSHFASRFLHYSIVIFCTSAISHAAETGDLPHLKAHWNFDEARDWHNMPYPFTQPLSETRDSVGKNNLSINDKLDPVKAWASGRQFSAVRFDAPGQFLKAAQPLNTLKKTAALSFWLKTDPANSAANGTIIGDSKGMEWGTIMPDGKLAVRQQGKTIASTSQNVNDNQWHHIVIQRQADTGQVSIYMDGTLSGQGTGTSGTLPGEYAGFGSAQGGQQYIGLLDQIHLFDKTVSPETILQLKNNHAPKAFPQETLITRGKPSQTGSILHLYTFDPDQDALTVARHGQGQYGTVRSKGDGTFTYTPGKGFTGRDRFPVTVTDGRGGYSTTFMEVRDETTMPKTPVTKFTGYRELPSIGSGTGKTANRIPAAIDWDGNGIMDLLVCGNNRIWAYKNAGKKSAEPFSEPILVQDTDGKDIEAASIATLKASGSKHPLLIVRDKTGLLHTYELVLPSKASPRFRKTGTIQGSDGKDFKCPSNAMAFGDYDNNGSPDLLAGDGGSGIYLYRNTGKKGEMQLNTEREHVIHGSYNLGPYFADLNGDGKTDLLHGVNWGSIHYWINGGGSSIIDEAKKGDIQLTDANNEMPKKGDKTVLRAMNGTLGALADFNGDGIIDLVLGSYNDGILALAYGVDPNEAGRNLAKIEQIYNGHETDLGKYLEADGQKMLNRYKTLNREWITWATSLPTVAQREQAYRQLKKHIAKYPFLKRSQLDAWVKRKDGKITEFGPMHHVPGIVVMNWVTLHNLKPDSMAHRIDVADTLGLKGLDREQYLKSGVAVADNSKCSDGQMMAIRDFMHYHPRILFPDDHISIDQNMGDGREAMSYVFKSNKNTFGCDVGGPACESARDLVQAAEKHLGKDSAKGDYFTFVMGHEVCHSLDAYVYGRTNKNLADRWNGMLVYAANNGGAVDLIVPREDGLFDLGKTQEQFKQKGLWDGQSPWNEAWKKYWNSCPYKDLTFMRGNIGWFLEAKQETLATQANHHWAGSEARLVGAIDRYNRGYKANINEVVFFLDLLSAGLNEIPMYNITATKSPNRAQFDVEKAWLERNDDGFITKITIGPRVYEFELDSKGKVIAIKNHPFINEMK